MSATRKIMEKLVNDFASDKITKEELEHQLKEVVKATVEESLAAQRREVKREARLEAAKASRRFKTPYSKLAPIPEEGPQQAASTEVTEKSRPPSPGRS